MARLFTIPAALKITRAPIVRGFVGSAVEIALGAHVNVSGVRAIYTGTDEQGVPAVCIELSDALWKFTLPTLAEAIDWYAKTLKMAAVS